MNAALHAAPTFSAHPPAQAMAEVMDAPTAHWRVSVHDALTELRGLLSAVQSIDMGSHDDNAYALDIVNIAEAKLDEGEHVRRTGSADDYYGDCIREAHALLRGAMSMPDLSTIMRLVLTSAHEKVAEIAMMLDNAPSEKPSGTEAPEVRDIDSLMRGKALFCDMAEALTTTRGACYFEHETRAAGKSMNTAAVRAALLMAQADDDLLEGYCFAVAGFVANALDPWVDAYTAEEIRDLPATCFDAGTFRTDAPAERVSASGSSAAPAEGTPQPDPVFTAPFERRTDALLEDLDMYLEGLERIGLGEKAHTDLHKIAAPHFWNARSYLNAHDTPDRIVAEIYSLRDGLELLAAWIAPSPGIPLVRECIALIDAYLQAEDSGAQPAIAEDMGIAAVQATGVTQERLDIICRAGCYIEKLLLQFRNGQHAMKPQDWSALLEAASVVMSGASDELESDTSLADRLDLAMDSSSLLLQAQLPRHFVEGGALRAKDAGKVIVAATA